MAGREVSTRRAWVMAARPQTFPAGASPVVVGTALATHDGVFAPLPAVAALLGALCIQVGTNFANDYHDAKRGADTPDREGFTRVTAGGLIDPSRVKVAAIASYAVAVAIGTYLVTVGGLPILVVGVSGILAGVAYTGGPWPYGYRGLGDVFVFVYFGLVAVAGTYYVQAVATIDPTREVVLSIPPGALPFSAIAAGLPAAGLSTAILVVNNIRDAETDAAAGKRTLAVRLGIRFSRVQWAILVALAYVVPVGFALSPRFEASVLLALITIPLAVRIGRTVLTRTDGRALNPALERTGQLLAAHSACFAAGLVAPVL